MCKTSNSLFSQSLMLAIWNFAHVLTAAVCIVWWGLKVRMLKFAKWWRHTLELYPLHTSNLYLQMYFVEFNFFHSEFTCAFYNCKNIHLQFLHCLKEILEIYRNISPTFMVSWCRRPAPSRHFWRRQNHLLWMRQRARQGPADIHARGQRCCLLWRLRHVVVLVFDTSCDWTKENGG